MTTPHRVALFVDHVASQQEEIPSLLEIRRLTEVEGRLVHAEIFTDGLVSPNIVRPWNTALEEFEGLLLTVHPCERNEKHSRVAPALTSTVTRYNSTFERDIIFVLVIGSRIYNPMIEELLRSGRKIVIFLTQSMQVNPNVSFVRHLYARSEPDPGIPPLLRNVEAYLPKGAPRQHRTSAADLHGLDRLMATPIICSDCGKHFANGWESHGHVCGKEAPRRQTGFMTTNVINEHARWIETASPEEVLDWLVWLESSDVESYQIALIFAEVKRLRKETYNTLALLSMLAVAEGTSVSSETVASWKAPTTYFGLCVDKKIVSRSSDGYMLSDSWRDILCQVSERIESLPTWFGDVNRAIAPDFQLSDEALIEVLLQKVFESTDAVNATRARMRSAPMTQSDSRKQKVIIGMTDPQQPTYDPKEGKQDVQAVLRALKDTREGGLLKIAQAIAMSYNPEYLQYVLVTLIVNGVILLGERADQAVVDTNHTAFRWLREKEAQDTETRSVVSTRGHEPSPTSEGLEDPQLQGVA